MTRAETLCHILAWAVLAQIHSATAGDMLRSAESPFRVISVSDSWTYQEFDPSGAPSRRIVATAVLVGAEGISIQHRVQGSLDRFANTVLDREGRVVREARPLAREAVAYRPPRIEAAWPLVPGKTWDTDSAVTATHWRGTLRARYRVEGWERLSVPAGEFDAIRVTWEGAWENGQRDDGSTFSGAERGTYWYAPAARAPIRIDRESPGIGTVRQDLVTFYLN